MRPVTSKSDGIRRWHLGEFGNKLRTWSVDGWVIQQKYDEDVGLRYSDPRGGGAAFEAHLMPPQACSRLDAWVDMGRDLEHITVCEEAPDHRLMINGELLLDHSWAFFHSRIKKPMRAALREAGKWMYGLTTRHTLKSLMSPSSWSDLEALVDLYPDHIVELSVYECLLGQCPGRNTIIWEVRKY